jgi:coenzyme F420-reducing hydrogenase delta subunit
MATSNPTVKKLQKELENLIHISQDCSEHATMAEETFQRTDLIKKMFSESRLNSKVVDLQNHCTTNINRITNCFFNIAETLSEMWAEQDKFTEKQTALIDTFGHVF